MRRRKLAVPSILIWIIVAQSIIILLLLVNVGTAVEAAGWVSSVLVPLLVLGHNLLQRHSLRFFLLTQRLKNWFGGRSATWNFALRFNGDFQEGDLDELVKRLLSLPKYADSMRVKTPYKGGRFLMIRGGLNVEVSLQSSDSEPFGSGSNSYIHVAIQNLRVNYNEAINIIDKEIIPLVNEIENGLKPGERIYGMTVEFDKLENPFFGLYLDKFDPEDIADFQVLLIIKDYGERDDVTISDTKIQIVARSTHALANLGKEFLTFHPSLKFRLRHG